MSLSDSSTSFSSITEECEDCEQETAHEISIEMRTEGADSDHPEFSREPYRVSECQRCGETSTERMNNA